MNVEVNRWIGEAFESTDCICWACGKPATVVEIPDMNGELMARICKTCLNQAMGAISEAILTYHREKCADVKGWLCGG